MSIKKKITLAQKIITQAKNELNKEREENYRSRAKSLLEEIQTAKRTVDLLEKQLRNFMKEIDVVN